MNKIHLIGRLTKDPELIFAAGTGTAVSKFTLAVNRPRLDKNKPQEADFINCVCFGKRAETIANFVQKGHLFGISGRLQISKFVDNDGNNRWKTDVVVEDFEFLQGKNHNSGNSGDSSEYQYKPSFEDEFMSPVDDGEIPF